jgi:hypothetical protein
MTKRTKKSIDMVAGVSELLRFSKENPKSTEEKLMNHILKFIKKPEFKESKLEMIAAASYAIRIIERNPLITERQIIKKIVDEMGFILPED